MLATREIGPSDARTAGRWILGKDRLTCADNTLGIPARSGRVQAISFIVTSLTNGRHLQCRRYARILQHQPGLGEKQMALSPKAASPLDMGEHQPLLGSGHADIEEAAPLLNLLGPALLYGPPPGKQLVL